ncbi:MAG: glutathione S-transferase family protein [Alphaproteobacteria bacterium]|nr:glutathione S-transferase family protein [Alphaproteobacteria bacterium]
MSELTLIIGNRNYSSWSLRAWLVLKKTGAAFEETVIPLGQPDSREQILRFSPSGLVPVLLHGERTIWETLAIAEYLAELFPDARLWPKDPEARAMARAISAEMHAGFTELRHNMPMNIRASHPGAGMTEAVQKDINRIEAIWLDCRKRFGFGGEMLFGSFTIADAMFAPVATRFTTYGVKLGETAEAYVKALAAYPAMGEWTVAAGHEPWIVPANEMAEETR